MKWLSLSTYSFASYSSFALALSSPPPLLMLNREEGLWLKSAAEELQKKGTCSIAWRQERPTTRLIKVRFRLWNSLMLDRLIDIKLGFFSWKGIKPWVSLFYRPLLADRDFQSTDTEPGRSSQLHISKHFLISPSSPLFSSLPCSPTPLSSLTLLDYGLRLLPLQLARVRQLRPWPYQRCWCHQWSRILKIEEAQWWWRMC